MTQIITLTDLERWFTYHPPRDGQRARYEELRAAAFQLARLVFELTPPGCDQSAALQKLREVVWTASAGIACEGPVQSAYFARKHARKRVGGPEADEGFTSDPDEDKSDDKEGGD